MEQIIKQPEEKGKAMTIYEKDIVVDKKLVNLYERAIGELTANNVEVMLSLDGVDYASMTDQELEEAVNKSVLKELEDRRHMSDPEKVKLIMDYAKR